MTREQVAGLRRAIEDFDSAHVEHSIFRDAECEAAMIAKLVGHRHDLLAYAQDATAKAASGECDCPYCESVRARPD